MFRKIKKKIGFNSNLDFVKKNTLVVRNFNYLMQAMKWGGKPVLDYPHLNNFNYLEDLNERRKRDAEVILGACLNENPEIILEIGTSYGQMTYMMSRNVGENTKIYTVNIPPEEIDSGGSHTTHALKVEDIGSIYKRNNCDNIIQILANTAYWKPDFGTIDIAFIDGSHDTDFVYRDTINVLKQSKSGTLVIWHDFNPSLAEVYPWINSVCIAVEKLYKHGYLKGKILHLQDSWVGLYKVE